MHPLIQTSLRQFHKKNPPAVKPGDTIRVFVKIVEGEKERVQPFEGLVIRVRGGRGMDGTFTVRRVGTHKIGVERTFPLHAPYVLKVERLKTAKVRRANLRYMRTRFGKAARFKTETRTSMVWEEPEAERELEKLEVEKIKAAEEKIHEKEEQKEELEKEFEAAVEAHKETALKKEGDDQRAEPGEQGGAAGGGVSEEKKD